MSLESPRRRETIDGDGAQDENQHLILPEIVRGIVDAMNAGNISELEIEHHDLRLVLKARSSTNATPAINHPGDDSLASNAEPAAPDGAMTHLVTAPMIGTFYLAPAPGEEPFVQVGDHVDEGQTIGIIEAMKIMNEIASDYSGEVVEVIAENGQTVEYGSPLVRLRTGG